MSFVAKKLLRTACWHCSLVSLIFEASLWLGARAAITSTRSRDPWGCLLNTGPV